jgi:hypothetical protein
MLNGYTRDSTIRNPVWERIRFHGHTYNNTLTLLLTKPFMKVWTCLNSIWRKNAKKNLIEVHSVAWTDGR